MILKSCRTVFDIFTLQRRSRKVRGAIDKVNSQIKTAIIKKAAGKTRNRTMRLFKEVFENG